MAEVRVDAVQITLDKREAENLMNVLSMLGSLAQDYYLDSLYSALQSHSILPDWWASNKRLVLEDEV